MSNKYLVIGPPGTGKALYYKARILTPKGWVRASTVKEGDLLFDMNGDPTKVIGVYPQGRRQLYTVTFSDGTQIKCDLNHLWVVRVLGKSYFSIETTEWMMEQKSPVMIPLTQPIQFPGNNHIGAKLSKRLLYGPVKARQFYINELLSTGVKEISLPTSHQAKILRDLFRGLGYYATMEKLFDRFIVRPRVDVRFKVVTRIEKWKEAEAVCFKVDSPSETYIIDGYTVTHNTTYVKRQAERAAEKHNVLLLSYTQAAAKEMGRRIENCKAGTIHSVCYHLLDKPDVLEGEWLDKWNEAYPKYRVGYKDEDGFETATLGARLLNSIMLDRVNMRSVARDMPQKFDFYRKWNQFKQEHNLVDFCDMIEAVYRRGLMPPNRPDVIFIDEAQDLSLLEMRLVEMWASRAKVSLWVGDKLQSLYAWRGAHPDILNPQLVPQENVRTLGQSWRVPRVPQQYAVKWVCDKIPDAHYYTQYKPTDKDGFVKKVLHTVQCPDAWLPAVLQEDKITMVLATCSYMLSPVISYLRKHAIPYHNPYTDRWNPLGSSSLIKKYRAWRAAFIEDRYWTAEEIKIGFGDLTKVFKHGYKKKVNEIDTRMPPGEATKMLFEAVRPEFHDAIIEGKDEWWFDHVKGEDYVKEVLCKHGADIKPRVIVGTIHSVKGGEADIVVLCPDISQKAHLGMYKNPNRFMGREAVYRTFYVGMTRCKEGLYLLSTAATRRVVW